MTCCLLVQAHAVGHTTWHLQGLPGGTSGLASVLRFIETVCQVMAGTAVYRTSTGCSDRDAVGHLAAGQQVSVQQVPC